MLSSTPTLAYSEILDFLPAGTTPEEIVDFRPSAGAQARFAELVERKKSGEITEDENEEMQAYLNLQHVMIMAKARARAHMRNP